MELPEIILLLGYFSREHNLNILTGLPRCPLGPIGPWIPIVPGGPFK